MPVRSPDRRGSLQAADGRADRCAGVSSMRKKTGTGFRAERELERAEFLQGTQPSCPSGASSSAGGLRIWCRAAGPLGFTAAAALGRFFRQMFEIEPLVFRDKAIKRGLVVINPAVDRHIVGATLLHRQPAKVGVARSRYIAASNAGIRPSGRMRTLGRTNPLAYFPQHAHRDVVSPFALPAIYALIATTT